MCFLCIQTRAKSTYSSFAAQASYTKTCSSIQLTRQSHPNGPKTFWTGMRGRLAVVYSASSSAGPDGLDVLIQTPFGQTRDLRKLRSQFTFQQLVRGPTHSVSSALNECTQCDERQTEFALRLMCLKERSPIGVYADYIEVINNCVRVGLSDLFAAHRYRWMTCDPIYL